MSDREHWDTLASEKSPMRAAWDDDTNRTVSCLAQLLPWLPHEGNFLDLGCGPGRLTIPLARLRPLAYFFGVDVSPRMVKDAEEPRNVCYLVGDGKLLPDLPPLNAAWSVLLFQHLDQDVAHSYFKQVCRLLEPAGTFILQFPDGAGDRFPLSTSLIERWADSERVEIARTFYGRVSSNWIWTVIRK